MRDAIVLGAGPAGAVAAAELAARGRDVLLVDRARFPRDKVCGGCLHPDAAASIRAAGLGEALRHAVPVSRYRLAAAGRAATLPLAGWLACSRRALDEALVRAAVARGVELRDGTRAEPGPPGLAILDGAPERARVVLDARGLAGEPARSSRAGAGAVHAGPLPGYDAATVHMACGRGGYVGVVRAEQGRHVVAAALAPRLLRAAGSPARAAAAIVREAGLPELPADLAWRGTPLLTRRRARPFAERLLVLGDAAGYAEPFTGEGMAWAVASARAAAALVADGWRADAGRAWARSLRRLVARRQRRCRMLARALRAPFVARAAVALLARQPALARPFLAGGTA